MIYNDEQIMDAQSYQLVAQAYHEALLQNKLIMLDASEPDETLVKDTLSLFSQIKASLLSLGGFMNTSQFYSLNERQIKKMEIIFEQDLPITNTHHRDKTKNFLMFLSCEFKLIKNMTVLAKQSRFEKEILSMATSRLSLISKLLSVYF